MKIQRRIEAKLAEAFSPAHMEVINESSNHRVPPGSESHFKVVLVTHAFQGKPTLSRHRMVNQVLQEELAEKIHALSLRVFTPEQWQASGGHVEPSPLCAHARKE